MKKIDYPLLIAVLILSIFGLIMIYSASNVWALYKFDDAFRFVKHQGLFFLIGLILLLIISKIPYFKYYEKSNKILILVLLLLVLVLIPGIGTVRNGSRSWFGIGSFGLQPSEAAKIGLLIFTAKYLVNNEKNLKNVKKGVLPILGIIFLTFGLIMLQPDFGTGVIIVISTIGLLFVGGVNLKFFIKNVTFAKIFVLLYMKFSIIFKEKYYGGVN